MLARIKKSEIEAFKIQAANIKPNTLMPILSYLKIEINGDYCEMTKSNNEAFVIRTSINDSENCEFLINESVLYSFAEYSAAEYIEFEKDGNRIKIFDQYNATRSPTEPSHLYPKLDKENNTDPIELPKLVLVSAGICANIIFDGEVFDAKSFVFVGKKCVAASDATIGFLQKIGMEELPEIVLRKEVAICLSRMNRCIYCKNNNYDLFQDEATLFGYIRAELQFFDMNLIMPNVGEKFHFTINKNALMKFNAHCVSITDSAKSLAVTMKGENNILSLEMVLSKLERDTRARLFMRGEKADFKYDPAAMTNLLKCIPCEEVYFYEGNKRYYVTDAEKSFVSVIMLII
jgi:DNA polymerase III sliding clamp (beta) subunit (PCNA family)